MTKSAVSLFCMGIYGLCLGLSLITIPNTIITLFHLPQINEGWARLIGILAIVISVYDMYFGKQNILPMIKLSMYVRFAFAIATILLVAFKQLPLGILFAGGIDAIGGLWTMLALQSETAQK